MKNMHRLGLTALVLAVGTLFLASPALAGKKADTGNHILSLQLAPPAIDAPEPDASGTCTVRQDSKSAFLLHLTLKCTGLTPGAQYDVVAGVYGYPEWHTFTADARGRLNANFPVEGNIASFSGLWIVNASGELVLEGPR